MQIKYHDEISVRSVSLAQQKKLFADDNTSVIRKKQIFLGFFMTSNSVIEFVGRNRKNILLIIKQLRLFVFDIMYSRINEKFFLLFLFEFSF